MRTQNSGGVGELSLSPTHQQRVLTPRWKWAIDGFSRTLITFENGLAFEALAWDGGDWAGFGKPATVYSVEGREWRPYRTLPEAFRA